MSNPSSTLRQPAQRQRITLSDSDVRRLVYGPQAPAFDGTWKLNDIAEVK